MARHVLTAVPLALFVLIRVASAEALSNNQLTVGGSAFQSELAFQFFDMGSRIFAQSGNATISTFSAYDDSQCNQDIEAIKSGLLNFDEWAIEYPDSWGRIPIGLMWGHAISMGQFEECIGATRKISESHTIRGKYCLAKVPIKSLMNKINKRDDWSRAISYKRKDPEAFELGVCVPKSCSPAKTNEVLKEVIKKMYGQALDASMVNEDYCRTDEPIKWRGIDIFAIVFFCFILFCLIASSIYDYVQTKKKQPKKPLYLAFSVLTNAPKIFTVKKVDNPNVIHCLNGIRCFSMMWVVFGHGYMTVYDLPHINKNKIYNWIETPFSMLVQNGSFCVDTFFFMSGLLILWGAFREMEKTKGYLNIKMMYVHRYVRLTPVLAVLILYIMSLYKYTGAGPMWMKLGIQDKICENNWWATLLYVQNYAFPYDVCVSQSWYLAVDTQLYVLSPLFIIPLWKWGKKAMGPIAVVLLLCLGSTVATFVYYDFTLFRVQDDNVGLRQRLTYYPTHTRLPTWLLGVIFGYFLFTKNRGRKIPLKKQWVVIGWLLAFGIMLADLWGPYWRIRPENPDSPIYEGAIYEPLSRLSWAMAIGWIVWACYNGHGGVINDFLSWGFFTGFSRLTYCMYVIHRIVQLVTAARLQTDTHFSNYDSILRLWHDFGLALTISIFATLAFEAPILGIEKAIFGRSGVKPKKVEPSTPPTTIADGTPVEDPAKV